MRTGRALWTALLAMLVAPSLCALALAADPLDIEIEPPEDVPDGFVGGARGPQGGAFAEPSDVAVYVGDVGDPDDDKVFVSEAWAGRNARVQRLDADGNFELMWGKDVVRRGAVGDTGTGYEICTKRWRCQFGAPGAREGEFRQPTGLAVSQDTGHVYVMDLGNRRVQEFGAAGRFERAWGWGVASGASAFEVCTGRCRAGRRGTGGEGGRFAYSENGAVAVAPTGGNVFATDGGNARVLEFKADGAFLRAWGPGVVTGRVGFEVCRAGERCRSGLREDPRGLRERHWPRYVVVDRRGVVYLADGTDTARLTRFRSRQPLPTADARAALLSPLTPERGSFTGGNTLGMEIDSIRGTLVMVHNPFSTLRVDFVSRPGADATGLRTIDPTVYVRSVNGIGVDAAGNAYVAKSELLNPSDPAIAYEHCGSDRRPEACHGLMVVARESRRPIGVTTAPVGVDASSATLTGTVASLGAVSAQFQISRDGSTWRDVGPQLSVLGPPPDVVETRVRGLAPGRPYLARLVTTLSADRDESRPRAWNEWPFVTDRRPR